MASWGSRTSGTAPNIAIGSVDRGAAPEPAPEPAPDPALEPAARGGVRLAMKSASGSRSPACKPNNWSIEAGAAPGMRSSKTPLPPPLPPPPLPALADAGASACAANAEAFGTGEANGSKSSGSSTRPGATSAGAQAADKGDTPAAAGCRSANGSISGWAGPAARAATARAGAGAGAGAGVGAGSPSKSANGLLRDSGAPGSGMPAEPPLGAARGGRPALCDAAARRATPGDVLASTAARPRTTVLASWSIASSWITSSK